MKAIVSCGTIFLASLWVFCGCSQLKNETAPTSPSVSVHPIGFKDSTSANFHGTLFRTQLKWNVLNCKPCHGQRYDGGTVQRSCLTCHTQAGGPEACNTCHGGTNAAPPADLAGNTQRTARGVGAHQAHLAGGTIGAAVACNVCHGVPRSVGDAGHIDDGIAEVKTDTTSVFYRSNSSYTSSNGMCANTYCHGNFSNGNSTNVVTWTDTTGVNSAVRCGTCHGDVTQTDPQERARPGGTHPKKSEFPTLTCSNCHGYVVDENLNFRNKSLHINGRVD